ncbi:MAG: anthranilate phosphoribosyltransferase [Candidatus Cloacimonadota bacterium]|nr:MAG: anthranilate phosphoribosyltransferase [Candidatus Cloacimonadota bacterium]
MKLILEQLIEKQSLTKLESYELMMKVMSGEFSESEISALLICLRIKGETVDELTGFVQAMREKMNRIELSRDAIDLCGTGGDGLSTFNVSTCASFVVAGAGIAVAKHGNRSVSSKSGSADVLEHLGVSITMPSDLVKKCVEEIGLGFLFAPNYHPAMKHVMPVRKSLKLRTVFNMLGPLLNPCMVKMQVIGVYDKSLTSLMANVLKSLGSKRALIVHGKDGMDEFTSCDSSYVTELNEDKILNYELSPSDLLIKKSLREDLSGDSPIENAQIILDILNGKQGPKSDIVCINSAKALEISKSITYEKAYNLAKDSILSGKALKILEKLREVS